MKKTYKNAIIAIIANFLILVVLKQNGITVETWIGNFVGLVVILLPVQVLLFQLSNDESVSKEVRTILKIVFWFINVAFLAGEINNFGGQWGHGGGSVVP